MNETQSSSSGSIEIPKVQPQPPRRRPLKYSSLPGILQDARQLAAVETRTTGNWTYGQILSHLAAAYNGSFDGYGFQAALPIRLVARWFFKKKFLTQPMPEGFKLPKRAARLTPPAEVSVAEGLKQLERAIKRFEKEVPEAENPIFGDFTPEEWTQFHLRHAELHMSFVWPA